MGKKLTGINLVPVLGLVLMVLISLKFPGCSSAPPSASESAEAEICFSEGIPLPPYAEPVVILRGSDYEMGYQYAKQITQIFGPWLLNHPMVHPKQYTPGQLDALKAYQMYIRKHAPEMIDFFRGMAAGAADDGIPLTYEEVLAQFTDLEVKILDESVFPSEAKDEQLPPDEDKCSGFAAWGRATKDGKMIASGSSDGGDYMSVVMMCFPEEGNSFIWRPYGSIGRYFSMGGHPGLNEKGLMYVHHGSPRGPRERRYGLQSTIAIMHTLRFANNAQEAVDMQLSLGRARGGGFWADINGNAFVIERIDPPVIRKPGDQGEVDFLYATNTPLSREVCTEEEVCIPRAGCVSNNSKYRGDRNLQLWHMLTDYRGEVDFEFAKMMWRFTGPPLPLDSTPDKWESEATAHYEETQRSGWQFLIGRNQTSHTGIIIPDEMLFYVFTGHAGQHNNMGSPWATHGLWEYVPYATRTIFPLKLASSPAEVAKAAQYQAEIDLFFASRELGKLSYRDFAYAPLKEIYEKAVIEWTKGDYLNSPTHDIVKYASEDEAIYHWAKATRAFNRCQVLARQVYNALVPPATKPEDFGLRPFIPQKTSGQVAKDKMGNYYWKQN